MSLYVCAWLSEGVVDAFAWGVVAHQGLFLICLTKSFSPHCQLYKCKSYCQISSKRSLWSSLHSDSYSLYSLLIGSLTLSFQHLADVGVNTARQSRGWTCGFLAQKIVFDSSMHVTITRQDKQPTSWTTSAVILPALTFLPSLSLSVWSLTHYVVILKRLLCAILASLCWIDVSQTALLCLLSPHVISWMNPELMNVPSL